MKKIIVFILAFVAMQLTTKAQPFFFAGTLTINNTTECEIFYDAAGFCMEDCPNILSYYHSSTMWLLPSGGTVTYSKSTYPWMPAVPACSNFAWAYVDISFGQGDCQETKRLLISDCNFNGTGFAFYCTCNGQTVIVDWSASGGNIVVNIHH